MKYIILLTVVLATLLFTQNVLAESEPNNSAGTANVMSLNSNMSGTINGATTDQDWFKITTDGDGALSFTLTPGSSNYIRIYLYDADGATVLNSAYSYTAFNISMDGLAEGIYYIQVKAYYDGETINYTLSNTFTKPTQANDAEPNGTKSEAKVLPLNGTKTGHINYYNNLKRDTLDWYKITLPSDGDLTIKFSSNNGLYAYFDLFDNDGTTVITSKYTNGNDQFTVGGLAAGVYFVRIRAYYNYEFAPYTLSDSFYVPGQANDAELNNTKANALELSVNGTATGHIGYYYKNNRDTLDWYKLTLPSDGSLRIRIASNNATYVYLDLYDNDGITLVNSGYTNTSTDIYTDGLGSGTYFIRVRAYYPYQYAPYTLSDSLSVYSGNDAEPNKYAKQAATLLSNMANNGHYNFYYNKVRDTIDWFKINYTGTDGNMSVALNVTPNHFGDYYTWMQVYKDTSLSPVYSGFTNSSITANLSALTPDYYYVKIYGYYPTSFGAYSITPTFNQKKAKVILVTADTSSVCDSANSITIKCTKSKAPYTAKLYRFNKPYGNLISINNSQNFVIDNLPQGSYYVKIYGDGATGSAFAKTPEIGLMPSPANSKTKAIKKTQAKLTWNTESCANYFAVQYRKVSDASWTTKNTNGNTTFLIIKNLSASTQYYWRVSAADSANGETVYSAYTDSISFTTAASFAESPLQDVEDAISKTGLVNNNNLSFYPNPVNSYFFLKFNPGNTDYKVSVLLKDGYGNNVWFEKNINVSSLKNKRVEASNFASGVYILQIVGADNKTIAEQKMIVAH